MRSVIRDLARGVGILAFIEAGEDVDTPLG